MTLIKLYDFSAEDNQYEIEDEETSEATKTKKYTINMYGLDEQGKTYSVSTTYAPWFCVKLNGIVAGADLIDNLKRKVIDNEIRNLTIPKPWDKECSCYNLGEKKHTCGIVKNSGGGISNAWKIEKYNET